MTVLRQSTIFYSQFQSKLESCQITSVNTFLVVCRKRSPEPCSMPRPKLHRVACDCFECEQNMSQPALSPESSAAARQDPPPKCLFIHAEPAWPSERDGTAEASTSGAVDTPYLHRLAQKGCCGLVSYRESAPGRLLMPCLKDLHCCYLLTVFGLHVQGSL